MFHRFDIAPVYPVPKNVNSMHLGGVNKIQLPPVHTIDSLVGQIKEDDSW